MCNEAPYFLIMYNEYEKINVNGKEYDRVALETDLISKYVSREHFLYHVEGFPMLDPVNYVGMRIEFDPTTAYESMGYLMVKDYRIIKDTYNNGEKLKDYSDEPYPITYYQRCN